MSMQKWLDLTPAESLMLLETERPPAKRMIKLTFADLILCGVIKATVREEKLFFGTKKRIYINKGRGSADLKLRPHEKAIADLVYGEIRLDDLARAVFRSVQGLKNYADEYLRQPLCERGYLQAKSIKKFWILNDTEYVLTEKGLDARDSIQRLLDEGMDLQGMAKGDPDRARAYLSVCGSNILLLEDCDFKAVAQWSRELENMEEKQRRASDYYDYSWYIRRHYLIDNNEEDALDIDFDLSDLDFDILDSFDSFDDFDSAFDSDLGGDGGDGGDGGGDGGGGDGGGGGD